MPQFPNLKLVEERKDVLREGGHLRLYQTSFTLPSHVKRTKSDPKFKYHLGFPEAVLSPVFSLLQHPQFWGKYWATDGDFRIWSLPVFGDSPPKAELNKHYQDMATKHSQALKIAKKRPKRVIKPSSS